MYLKLSLKNLQLTSSFIGLFVLFSGCKNSVNTSSDPIIDNPTAQVLLDFEDESYKANATLIQANAKLINGENNTKENTLLELSLLSDEKISGIEFAESNDWNLDPTKAYCLVFDAKSVGDESTFLTVDATNSEGISTRRIVNVHSGEIKSYFFELTTQSKDINSGLRDTPVAWNTKAIPMKINGLLHPVDFSSLHSIRIYRAQGLHDKTLVIDNIRIIESPERDPLQLVGIVDKFGQNAKMDFPIKINSDEELRQEAELELKSLSEYTLMPDRSQYGGWKNGPKLEATGFFRKEKFNGKWALVDPEGYLFFSIGLANVRMANSTTYTGIDYKDENLKHRDPEDVTPEDSKGIVEVPASIMKTGYVIDSLRNNMFLELPSFDDALANHYSYRKESHFGPIEHGQTFSFYRANLERRYGESYPNSFIDKWLEVTENRMRNWGFTSFGNWIDPAFYERNKLPYFANGWIIGDFQKVYSGSDYWGPMPDPFDPEFERRAKMSIRTVSEEVKNNPWCIGVFIDNERSWGKEGSIADHYGLVLDGLSKDNSSYLKQEYMKYLQKKYGSITALNSSWQTTFSSWGEIKKGVNFKKQDTFSAPMVEDLSFMLEIFATRYFEVVHDALEEEMPNHMYLGCRFAVWGITPEVRKSAAKFVDVFSYNYYKEGIGKKYWKFLEEIDMPTLIGEYHMGASDSGLFHSGLVHASNQKDRAKMWSDYAYSVIDNPYLVGAHWFQYLDSPISGRAHDGENYNVGFVSNTDIPYPEMIKMAKEINSGLYKRRFGN